MGLGQVLGELDKKSAYIKIYKKKIQPNPAPIRGEFGWLTTVATSINEYY